MRTEIAILFVLARAASGSAQTKEIDIPDERFVLATHDFGDLWMFLWKNGKEFILPFIKYQRFNGLRSLVLIHRSRPIALKKGIDNLQANL
jgi:hypothetical protein